MKNACFIATLACFPVVILAQKESGIPKNNGLDSLIQMSPRLNQPFVMPEEYNLPFTSPSANASSFERLNPHATVINKTARRTIYKMPLDNMAVLVPDMSGVEKMPGRNGGFNQKGDDKMPNPYHPRPGEHRK